MFSKAIVGFDGAEQARDALSLAVALTARDGELVVCCVHHFKTLSAHLDPARVNLDHAAAERCAEEAARLLDGALAISSSSRCRCQRCWGAAEHGRTTARRLAGARLFSSWGRRSGCSSGASPRRRAARAPCRSRSHRWAFTAELEALVWLVSPWAMTGSPGAGCIDSGRGARITDGRRAALGRGGGHRRGAGGWSQHRDVLPRDRQGSPACGRGGRRASARRAS